MAINSDTTVKKVLFLPSELWRRISDFRYGEQIPSESKAMQRLISKGLDAFETERTESGVGA